MYNGMCATGAPPRGFALLSLLGLLSLCLRRICCCLLFIRCLCRHSNPKGASAKKALYDAAVGDTMEMLC